ncbi:PH domain-containing protein [Candidatus Tisiphia endosymbiont of Micropterix aruncella]|uniref:PH domain-containing protein n=1 Tax=Candidatus Tisiphia endosymbiont of Micropterix aruncella TaxID=3066271 RepID=UPI003AA92795
MEQIKPILDFRYYGMYGILICIPYMCILRILYISDVNTLILTLLILVPFILFGAIALEYHCTDFLIGADKVSYINSFINYTRVDIKYEDIKEVSLTRGVLQRICGLGAVSMISNATMNQAGVTFYSLKNPHEVYKLIQARIVEQYK